MQQHILCVFGFLDPEWAFSEATLNSGVIGPHLLDRDLQSQALVLQLVYDGAVACYLLYDDSGGGPCARLLQCTLDKGRLPETSS